MGQEPARPADAALFCRQAQTMCCGGTRGRPQIGYEDDEPISTNYRCNQFIAAAGRSFFTSSSDGITLAPSTYLKSDIVPLPSFSAVLPT